jgi:hypothetical protein
MNNALLSIALTLAQAPVAPAGEEIIPLLNRPANFSGAAGAYRLEVRATPTAVQVEDPIVWTVRIVSLVSGPWPHPPAREKLQLFSAELERNFFVEPIPEEDRFSAKENAWEFVWHFAPRRAGTARIPAPEFVYYQTSAGRGFKAADGGRSVPIEVRARKLAFLTAPAEARAKFEAEVSSPAWTQAQWPASVVWTALALPPILCLGSFGLLRLALPDMAQRLRRKRSRALKRSVANLPQASAEELRDAILLAVRLRVELMPGEQTPLDAEHALLQAGCRPETGLMVREILAQCEQALFFPAQAVALAALRSRAAKALRQLEDEPCAT